MDFGPDASGTYPNHICLNNLFGYQTDWSGKAVRPIRLVGSSVMAFASFEYRGPVKVWGSCTGPRSDDRFELSIEFNLYVSEAGFCLVRTWRLKHGVIQKAHVDGAVGELARNASSERTYLYVWGTFSSVTRASGGCLGVKRR